MLIWQIEAALERTRLFLTLAEEESRAEERSRRDDPETPRAGATARGKSWLEQATEKLAKARASVRQTEQPYEPHVADWEDWEPPEYIGVFKKGDIIGYHRYNRDIGSLDQRIKSLARGE